MTAIISGLPKTTLGDLKRFLQRTYYQHAVDDVNPWPTALHPIKSWTHLPFNSQLPRTAWEEKEKKHAVCFLAHLLFPVGVERMKRQAGTEPSAGGKEQPDLLRPRWCFSEVK